MINARKSFTSPAFGVVACMIALAAGVVSPAAFAENGGVHHGSMCQGSGASLSVAGVWNNTAGTISVFCPTVRDEVLSTHGLNHAYVFYRLQKGGTISCTVYSLTAQGTSVAAASQSGSASTGTLSFGAIAGASSGNYMIYCSVPAQGFITSYRIDEWS